MQTLVPNITRFIAAAIGLLWCYIEPSLNYIGVCFFALLLDCYTAWRLNRRIYSRYREAIKRNPKCNMDGKLKSKKMTKMVQDSPPFTAESSSSAYLRTKAPATEQDGRE